MAGKKKIKKVVDDDDIKPDGYIGDITAAEYWEWRCACAEKNVAKHKHENNSLMHKLMTLEVENKKLTSKIFSYSVIENSKGEMKIADNDLQDTRKKLSTSLGHPIEGCIINEAFQVLKPEGDTEVRN